MALVEGLRLVTENRRSSLGRTDQARLDDALAGLIASTRRGKRKLTLVEVAEKMHVAIALLGSLRAVADRIGLSEEMVRQFTRVEKLSPSVKQLAASGRLTSVDLADRLSRFPPEDQLQIARAVLSGDLTPADVRALLGVRKSSPRAQIRDLMDRIKSTRNIREYVAEFLMPRPAPTSACLMKRLSKVVGGEHLRRLEIGEVIGRAVLDTRGKLALEDAAKRARLTKRELLRRLVSGEVR